MTINPIANSLDKTATAEPWGQRRPVLGVSTVVRRGGKVLMVKRGREPLKEYWTLPGGHIEAGERAAEAAAREVREETGVEVGDLRQIQTSEIIRRNDAGAVESHFVLLVFEGAYRSGEPAPGDDAAEARWVAEAEIAGLLTTDDVLRAIAAHG